jgi:hypothetical protein
MGCGYGEDEADEKWVHISVGKRVEKRARERIRRSWEINGKMNLREKGCEDGRRIFSSGGRCYWC